MFEYSDFYNSNGSFSGHNPKKTKRTRKQELENIKFKLYLVNRKINISINKDSSLEDLYLSIYDAVYPNISTDIGVDVIPPAGLSHVPMIYSVSLYSEKTDTILDIPLHKFITISSYMQANPDYFTSVSIIGKPVYTIYVMDEYLKANLDKYVNKKPKNYIENLFSCYYSRKEDIVEVPEVASEDNVAT